MKTPIIKRISLDHTRHRQDIPTLGRKRGNKSTPLDVTLYNIQTVKRRTNRGQLSQMHHLLHSINVVCGALFHYLL